MEVKSGEHEIRFRFSRKLSRWEIGSQRAHSSRVLEARKAIHSTAEGRPKRE